jgi:hypothetical protein
MAGAVVEIREHGGPHVGALQPRRRGPPRSLRFAANCCRQALNRAYISCICAADGAPLASDGVGESNRRCRQRNFFTGPPGVA